MHPSDPPSGASIKLSVGEAKRILERSHTDLLDHQDVQGVGVGVRDNHAAFIVTVPDLKARERFVASFPDKRVGDLPLHVDISSICETSAPITGFDMDVAALSHRPPLHSRVARFFRDLGTLFVP